MPYTIHNLSEERALEELGVNRRKLNWYVNWGLLTVVRAGRNRLFSWIEIARLLDIKSRLDQL